MAWSGLLALRDASGSSGAVFGSLILAAVLGVAALVLWFIKKRSVTPRGQDGPAVSGGFTVEHLESLHRAGQISDEEFSRLRRQVLGLAARADSPPSRSSSPPADDDGKSNKTDSYS
jgi:uncharacterized membrane protein